MRYFALNLTKANTDSTLTYHSAHLVPWRHRATKNVYVLKLRRRWKCFNFSIGLVVSIKPLIEAQEFPRKNNTKTSVETKEPKIIW